MTQFTWRKTGRLVTLLASLTAVACAGGGGSSGTGSTSASSINGAATTAASQAHWQTALAALGQPYSPLPIELDARGLRAWTDALALNWPGLRTSIDPLLQQVIRDQLTGLQQSTGIRVHQVRALTVDTSAPPAIEGDATGRNLRVLLPGGAGRWSIGINLDIEVRITTTLFNIPIQTTLLLDLGVRVDQIQVVTEVPFDLRDPLRPEALAARSPQLDMRITLQSASPLLGQVSGLLTQALDPVIRVALVAGAVLAQQEITGLVQQLPLQPFGLGGPGLAALPGPPALLPIADDVSDEIQRHHLPYDTLLTTVFDQPGYKNGTPIDYRDYGDSAIWTGHYLTAEAMRFDATGSPTALRGARTALDGLTKCLDVAGQGGLLSRVVVPLNSPAGQAGIGGPHLGFSGGEAYRFTAGISRDQYIGTMMGFVTTFLRIPAFRADAGALIARIVAYLDSHDWIAYDADGVTMAAPFGQSPDTMWSVIKAGNLVDRARFGALHDRNRDLARVAWFAEWTGSREVMESYYKFNLFHSRLATLIQTEADPALYREYLKSAEISHGAVAHHMNAWFDLVYAMAVPSVAPATAPRLQLELEHWTQRDRRSHPTNNSQDPAIATVLYVSPFLVNQALRGGITGVTVAAHPLPLTKRLHGDFLWQTHPFELDGGQTDPRQQHAGVDLLLPYWAGRTYGLLR